MIKKISVFVSILLLGFCMGWLSSLLYLGIETKKGYVSSITSGLENDFAIIELLQKDGALTPSLKKQFDEKFSQTVHLLMVVKPNYEQMTAIPTQKLCKLTEYHRNFGITMDGAVDSNINAYFDYISPIIKQEMASLQKWTGGEGCQINGTGSKKCRYRDESRCKDET